MAATAKGLFVTPQSQSELGGRINAVSGLFAAVRLILFLATLAWLFIRRPARTDAIESTAIFCVVWIAAHVLLAPTGSVRFMVPVTLPMLTLSACLLAFLITRFRAARLDVQSA